MLLGLQRASINPRALPWGAKAHCTSRTGSTMPFVVQCVCPAPHPTTAPLAPLPCAPLGLLALPGPLIPCSALLALLPQLEAQCAPLAAPAPTQSPWVPPRARFAPWAALLAMPPPSSAPRVPQGPIPVKWGPSSAACAPRGVCVAWGPLPPPPVTLAP